MRTTHRARLAILAACAVATATVVAQPVDVREGAVGPHAPERTDAGVFDGTWWYVNREAKIALWLRTVDGAPQVKLRYLSTASPEGFETDWQGVSDYITKIGPGTFRLTLAERDPNTIRGRWQWELRGSRSARIEDGTFTLFRTYDGRQMAMAFDDLERRIERDGTIAEEFHASPSLTFFKASKRLVRWEELPF